jgi:hypothetical protein
MEAGINYFNNFGFLRNSAAPPVYIQTFQLTTSSRQWRRVWWAMRGTPAWGDQCYMAAINNEW